MSVPNHLYCLSFRWQFAHRVPVRLWLRSVLREVLLSSRVWGGGGSGCCEPSRQVGNEETRKGLSLERSAETALGTRGRVLADCNGVSQRLGQPEPGDKWGSTTTTEQSQLPGLRRICAHCAIEVECRTRGVAGTSGTGSVEVDSSAVLKCTIRCLEC